MKNIIFDLDLTLIDTTCLEESRRTRNWQQAYSLIPQTTMYEGIQEVLDVIKKHQIPTAIVSTSPRPYIERIVAFYNIPCQHIVGYHDAKPIKPNPAPMLKALELMGASAKDTISFGDRVIDMQASNAAGIESVACLWGTKEKRELLNSQYSHAIVNPKRSINLNQIKMPKSPQEPIKLGIIEKPQTPNPYPNFTGIREYYRRENQLKYSMSYINGYLDGKSTVYHSNMRIQYEHFYERGKLLYSIRFNYILGEFISKFKIQNNNLVII